MDDSDEYEEVVLSEIWSDFGNVRTKKEVKRVKICFSLVRSESKFVLCGTTVAWNFFKSEHHIGC